MTFHVLERKTPEAELQIVGTSEEKFMAFLLAKSVAEIAAANNKEQSPTSYWTVHSEQLLTEQGVGAIVVSDDQLVSIHKAEAYKHTCETNPNCPFSNTCTAKLFDRRHHKR